MIIGLSGYAGSGKDEVAKILVEEYGFIRVAFADKIRELLFEMDPPVPMLNGEQTVVVGLQNLVEELGWDDAKRHPIIRSMMQNLGVGARKAFGDNHWVVEAYKGMNQFDNNYVITDVRFKNEAEWLHAFNGNLWRVIRPGVGPVNSHASETELDSYETDAMVINIGTLDDLRSTVRSLMESTLGNEMH